MAAKPDPAALEARLGYSFRQRGLLTEALTHVSRSGGGPTYQRLEFLGDRVLGLAVADLLMRSFPTASEGDLSRRLAELVRRETCAEVALAWEIGPYLRLGGGGTGAMRRNVSILGDVCEAVIGAVFMDGGFEEASALVGRAFAPRLEALAEVPANPKTVLQEWAAARGLPPPVYAIVDRSGPDHAPTFRIAARVQGLSEGLGEGSSRRAAEQLAAEAVLIHEGVTRPAAAGQEEVSRG
ncbi:ribonuclease III [Enterovirga rhinocerotis]|uniref:Ribonuclease 3 n=1 Tax=Enterovirga rhinocerotis TaxID=1339210 RepID=A0A4R7C662_9HYPH|nr:ribonuclease III [Enterovirga rhinocerotis]TDR93721.1 ribonuclease-3 [Enterovirga rhinocerotis]